MGASFLGVRTREDFGQDFDQPAGDLRISGRHLAQDHLELEIDARARHTYRRPTEGAKVEHGIEPRLSRFAWHGRHPLRPRASYWDVNPLPNFESQYFRRRVRHLAPRAMEWRTDRGSSTHARRSRIFDRGDGVGCVLSQASAKGSRERAGILTLAGIASYRKSEINREYLYLQGSWADPQWSLFASQELDLNRGWKTQLR